MSNAKTVMSQAANTWAGPTYIEDVFSTYLYTGNGSTSRDITNNIDLSTEGGLVWIKGRTILRSNTLFDTERGAGKHLKADATAAEATSTTRLNSFLTTGFNLGNDLDINGNSYNYASWTFRKAPRFFDVVTYTGDGTSGRTISHNLGIAPGCVIVKRIDSTRGWGVYHRSIGATNYLVLESTQAAAAGVGLWNDTEPTDSVFTVGNNLYTNGAGASYVAYLFAHDPLGPSGDGSDGLIACGSYTGNGSTDGPEINLGWEPQWVMVKRTDDVDAWNMYDVMRGWQNGTNDSRLRPDTSDVESSNAFTFGHPTATGFKIDGVSGAYNASGGTYIYIAIRRGPMRQPTSGTEVFDAYFNSSSVTLGQSTGVTIVPDFVIARDITAATRDFNVADRMRGAGSINPDASFSKKALYTNLINAEASDKPFFDIMNRHGNVTVGGEGAGVSGLWGLFLKRAPGFFDVTAYEGDGLSTSTFNHNLGVTPELMIIKNRDDIRDWCVYHKDLGATYLMNLNSSSAAYQSGQYFPADPTETVFRPGSASATNRSGYSHIAYLFATLPGVSKVGSYTGNGSSQTINCGFTSGARFVLIKRTDSTGDWYVWDTKQGIVAGNDPRLKLNDPGSQITTDDSIDPDNSGFIVNQVAATDINVSSASYIYLAIA